MSCISGEGKLTLREVERKHNLGALAVAAIACVEPSMVYRMEQGGSLAREEAERILRSLSQVTCQHCTSETVGGCWVAAGGELMNR